MAGWTAMARFGSTPGLQSEAPHTLPVALLGPGDSRRPTLVVALHPQCSCSLATMHELDRVLAASHQPIETLLLVYTPSHAPAHWAQPHALLAAAAPLHARVLEDLDGATAASLGARTSGQVLLYSARGRLLFQGGVTAERGHEGENASGDLLATALASQRQAAFTPGVFGCPLFPLPARHL